ncbi:MAG: hypothetical protein PVS3B3_31890 [Ktedonobacteraceae bacterium]
MIVTYPGKAPYKHEHIWMSEGWMYAPVELVDWQKQTQQEQKCTLEIVKWTLEERTDIGY